MLALIIGNIILLGIEGLAGGSEMETLISGIIAGVVTGGIGGLMTGLGLKTAEPRIKSKHIFGLIIGWSAIWSIVYILMVFVVYL